MVSLVCQWQQIIGADKVLHAACTNRALLATLRDRNCRWNLVSSSHKKQCNKCFQISWNTGAGKENVGNWDLGCIFCHNEKRNTFVFRSNIAQNWHREILLSYAIESCFELCLLISNEVQNCEKMSWACVLIRPVMEQILPKG